MHDFKHIKENIIPPGMRGIPHNRISRPGKHIINNYSMLFFLLCFFISLSLFYQKHIFNPKTAGRRGWGGVKLTPPVISQKMYLLKKG